MRHVLVVAVLAFAAVGCATSGGDAPRTTFEAKAAPPSPLDTNNPGEAASMAASAAAMQATGGLCVGPDCKPGASKPCGGGCPSGEYCDQSSGIDRCIKDVIPAASTPRK